jgi:tetratricopeptide (TPR) repeat protein
MAVIALGLGSWQVITYMAAAKERAAEEVQAGIRLLSPGHYHEALPHFDRALEMDPNSWTAYYQRGLAHDNLHEQDEAAADYTAALNLKPDLVEARVALAAIYRGKGDFVRAVEELTRAIGLRPTSDSYFQRGTTYADLGQHEKAIEDFTWVIHDLRDAPYVYFARAESKRALGDAAGAAEDEAAAMSFYRGPLQ